jgi:hypothetical protein
MTMRLLPTLAAFTALGAFGAASEASAQTCNAGSGLAVCIEQVGDFNTAVIDQAGPGTGNRAVAAMTGSNNRVVIDQKAATDSTAAVTIRGSGNGRGSTPGASVATNKAGWVTQQVANPLFPFVGPRTIPVPVQNLDQGPADPLTVEPVEYGKVVQEGDGHTAVVAIAGDRNGFHVGQRGADNVGVQMIAGSDNGAAVLQEGQRNVAAQGLAGSFSRSYLEQTGTANVGLLLQASNASAPVTPLGVAELVGRLEIGALGRAGGGTGNTVLLEQSGDRNIAALAQAGSANSLALRQTGGAFAAITQNGGNSLSITQTGSTPIIVTQR